MDYEVTLGTNGMELVRRATDGAIVGVLVLDAAGERELWVANLGTNGSTVHDSRDAALRAIRAHADADPSFRME